MLDSPLKLVDPDVSSLAVAEAQRQQQTLRLIPSENYASRAVMEAAGLAFNNKYSEGYAGRRYYQGQEHVDAIEQLAKQRLLNLFGGDHVNVQPYSGSPANLAVYFAFCKPGDTIMGMGLPSGGHLTHGWGVSITGSYFNSVQYGVRQDTHKLDMDGVAKLAREHRPKLLWCGATAYPRVIDYSAFREIADEVGALLVADIAHISGLVAGGAHPTPIGVADVVTSTTHKTFRGPRGGMIFCKSAHAKAIDKAVFPGLQGGPHNNTTAALAVAANEASTPDFKRYAHAVVENARALAEGLLARGFELTTGGTDNHLLLCDLTPQGVSGKVAATALERGGIICNYNSVPFDKRKPFDPSGIRLGTPAITTRGMGVDEMDLLADWIDRVIADVSNEAVQAKVRNEVFALCEKFPAPGLTGG